MAGPSQYGPTPAVALTPLEVALTRPLGLERGTKALSVSRRTVRDPVKAIGDVLVEALSRPPCLLSFSGGRDSSGLLALATKLSREQGLELPVPATMLVRGGDRQRHRRPGAAPSGLVEKKRKSRVGQPASGGVAARPGTKQSEGPGSVGGGTS